MSASVDQFGKAIVSAGLLATDELMAAWGTLSPEARPVDGAGLAKLLVEQGKLSAFQAQEILAGRASRLVLGDYVVLDEIGAGGMGRVYKARHRRMQRIVALKVMSAAAMKDEASVKRFQREVRAAAKLEHPNIVTAYASGEAGSVKYLVMQFVDGGDLSSLVKKNGPLAIEQAADYVVQAARGLAYAHGEGVIHRDIKPANLLVDKKGTVKILDMGLARIESSDDGLTATEQVMGTVDYMSPEQASNTKGADARADVYALGCTLWFVLTGKKLYEGDSMISRLLAHRDAPLPSLLKTRDDAPWGLEQALHRMIAKRPAERFQSMDDVAAALAPYGPSTGAAAPTGSSIGQSPGPQNAELAAFFQSSPLTASATNAAPSNTHATVAATMQFTSPDVGTDAKRTAAASAPGRDTKRNSTAAPTQKQSRLIPVLGGAAVAVVGLVAWLATRGGSKPEQPPIVAATAPVPPPPTQPPPAARQPTAPVVVVSAAQSAAVANKLEATQYVWTIPENLGARINDGTHNRTPTLTADQLCLIVDSDPPGHSELVEYRRASKTEPWGPPRYGTAEYDGEERPCLSADGLELIFDANGAKWPGNLGLHDLLIRRRPDRDAPWGPSENLGPNVNGATDDYAAALSPNGLWLAFSSTRPGGMGGVDLYVCRRPSRTAPFGPAENLGRTINSGGSDLNPHFLGDDGLLLFERDGWLHVTFRNAAGAVGAISLPNQTEPFPDPWLSPEGDVLYFGADNRRGGLGGTDVWMTRRVPRDSPDAKRVPPPVELPSPPKIEAVVYQGHAYQWVREPALTWFDAERLALSMGGHLVAVNSREEDDWLKTKLLTELPSEHMAWIGGLKEADGVWKWTNGEPLDYVGWNPLEGGDGATAAMGLARQLDAYGWADWPAGSRAIAQTGPIKGTSRNVGFVVEWNSPTPVPPKPVPPQPAP